MFSSLLILLIQWPVKKVIRFLNSSYGLHLINSDSGFFKFVAHEAQAYFFSIFQLN